MRQREREKESARRGRGWYLGGEMERERGGDFVSGIMKEGDRGREEEK